MMPETTLIKTSELRRVITRVINRELTPGASTAVAAQAAYAAMVRHAEEHGLTEADVTRALLTPILDEKHRCGCPSCEARRGEASMLEAEIDAILA